ncbi:FAD-dependent oxidoreductase [Sphingobacterium sp. SYP-B4668]|uniref:FAD-dependent oxidoreductase n=1 Tax=Sphingobacterium sp. SYP-B4668 TaxID=2996035 RepID=UPI0022DCF17C|nr:FAD-dependent oxidoreductase [Sphingobacterium sp. SYP-B4668]
MRIKAICFFFFVPAMGFLISCKKAPPLQDPIPDEEVLNFNKLSGVGDEKIGDEFDVVIYGGTASAIMAAIEIVQSNKSVIVVNPRGSGLGGMTTNGLGSSDFTSTTIIGGLAGRFYQDLKREYSNPLYWIDSRREDYTRLNAYGDKMMFFEPKMAQKILQRYIMHYKIPIIHLDRLNLTSGVVKSGNTILMIKLESGRSIKGKVFIDASYEGDLMAKAGVSYTVGRESSSTYNEDLNGVNVKTMPTAEFHRGVQDKRGILKNWREIGKSGGGDEKVQAYCYRLPLTNVAAKMVPVSKPLEYNENDYDFLFQYSRIQPENKFIDLYPLPNGKTDTNNSGPISIDFVGANYGYPDGSHEVRDRIVARHRSYIQGFLWTLINHPDIPSNIRERYGKWGLSKDEFIDNDNWPYQLYVREARRMVSDYVMTQADCEGKTSLGQSIGKALYAFDSHVVQRYVAFDGNVKNEGGFHKVLNVPYTLNYGLILPKKIECSNLLVPICVSASHVAYSSLRMEPTYMVLGQSAACAALIALKYNLAVQDINYNELKAFLLNRRVVI